MNRMMMVLGQEFQLEVDARIADECLTESITMELLVVNMLMPNQQQDKKNTVLRGIVDATEAYYLDHWDDGYIGRGIDACFQDALCTYPIHESIFSPSYHVSDYLSSDHPPQKSIMNHFMERITDLIGVTDMLDKNPADATDENGADTASPRCTVAAVKAVIGLLADNHTKHLLIKKPLKKLLSTTG